MQVQGNLEQVLSAARNRRQHRRQPYAAAAAAPPGNDSAVLADLLLKATDKRSQDIDVGVLRRIKALCRKSEEHVRAVHEYLLHALEASHAQVRCHAMEICDQLFQRSHLFRQLMTQHLPQILEHAVGTKASRPLPGPPNEATRLHEKALESIDQWADKYGAYYQQLRVTMRYLRDVLQMRFPQLRARAAAAEAEVYARQARAQEILREKLTSIVGTYDETSREIQSTLTQMDEAFELLMTKPDRVQRGKQHLAAQDEEGLEWEDVMAEDAANDEGADEEDVEGLSEYRDAAVPEDLLGSTSVMQNPDAAVLETLTELNQLLGGSHMRTVNEWLRILTQVVMGDSGSDEDREREQLLRRATGLRGSITRAQDRYGAVMDAFKMAEDVTLGMGPAQQQVEGPSTGMRQGPNEAVPPWLARQQPDLADLFVASSSDDVQAPEQATKSVGGTLDAANPDQTHTGADSLQAPKKGTSTTAAANSLTQTAAPAASYCSGLGTSTQQPELPASPLGAQREGEAQRRTKAAAMTPAQRAQRINYGAVAAQLKREPSDSISLDKQLGSSQAVQPCRGSSGQDRATADGGNGRLKRKAGSMTEQPAAMSLPSTYSGGKASQKLLSIQSQGARSGSKHRDAWAPVVLDDSDADEEGDAPRYGTARTEPWEADKDASRATPGDTSADIGGPQPKSTAAKGRGADRRQKGSRISAQGNASANPEDRKTSIPEALKQALAAEAPLVPSGPHLAYWDSKDQALVNARGMQVYNHWGPVDEHKTLPTERLNELFGSMASYYKPPTKQDLVTAGMRKADLEKPSFKDEPLEAQKLKRPRAPVTAILPPVIARLVAASTPKAHVGSSAQPAHTAGPTAAEPEQATSADQADHSTQRAAYLWPSQAPLGDHHRTENQGPDLGTSLTDNLAAGQELEVEELEWNPGEAAGTPSGRAPEATPAEGDQQREPTPMRSQAGGGRAKDPEKPSKGQRALDKAHNDAVLAEAATRDPILAHRWAAQQASKTEKTKKAQGAKKKLGVRASLAKKLLSKTAVMSAAHDMSVHEAEAHQDLNTNRWEEK